jgi:hypothetical protein
MWSEGERRLTPGEHLPKDLVTLLWREKGKVLRSLDGETFEFRHDQMRGYLAARWLAIHMVAPLRLLQDDASIWRLSRSDQEVVWSFFSAMITEYLGVEIWRWTTEAPERALLQQSLQDRARREGWHLSMPRSLRP